MDEIPAWALERARHIIADSIILNTNTKMEIQRGDMDDVFRELLPFARALVAERERAVKIIDDFMAQHEAAIECDDKQSRHRVACHGAKILAAAIRKGE